MTQPSGEESDEKDLDARAPAQHARIAPVHGNARRRTLLLLAVTGLTVVGIHFGFAARNSPTRTTAGPTSRPSASGSAAELTYYVSPTGSDSAPGTSPSTAWRTLSRAGRQSYQPGQRLLLQGGSTFTGSLEFKAGVAGDAAHPVIVGTYGTGQAVISSSHAPAVTIFDTAGITLQNLTLEGPGADSSASAGVDVYNTLSGNRKLAGLTISGLDVSGFRDGISIGGGAGTAGFTNVSITGTKAHANRDNGIITYGPTDLKPSDGYPIQSLTISGVAVYDNLGDASDHQRSTGSGMSLGGVDGGKVENSVAYGNGGDCDSSSGPVGIWAHDSTGVIIEHNVSYANRTAGYTDGGGFDLDQSTFNSVLEYNLTYNNYGPGYMVYAGTAAAASSGNVVRFNVSTNDALSPTDIDSITYGLLMVDGYETNAEVYHNTVVQNGHGALSPLLNLSSSLRGASIRDNVFISEFGSLIKTASAFRTAQVELQGNAYYSLAAHWRIQWGGVSYTSLSSWRAATGQETLNGTETGSSADPGLAQGAPASWDPTHTQVPVPQPGAAAATAGLDLSARFGVDPGDQDYYGQAVSVPAMQGAVMPVQSSTSASASPSATAGN